MIELNRVKASLKEVVYSDRTEDDKYWSIIGLVNSLQPQIYQRLAAAEDQQWECVPIHSGEQTSDSL